MVMTDLIADMLTRIRNAQGAFKTKVDIVPSKINIEIARILKEEGYLSEYELVDGANGHKVLRLGLKYDKAKRPAIRNIRRISKPGRRVYIQVANINKTFNGLGISIISTSKGVITGQKARELNVGGELICEVW